MKTVLAEFVADARFRFAALTKLTKLEVSNLATEFSSGNNAKKEERWSRKRFAKQEGFSKVPAVTALGALKAGRLHMFIIV